MRILLATGNEPSRSNLVRVLEAMGHQVIHATATGEELLTAIERAGHLHAALLSHVVLGKGWPRLVRHLRRRAPHLPVVLLLGPGAGQAWRIAIMAGAFEALPASLPDKAVLRALRCALAYSLGKVFADPPARPPAPNRMGISPRKAAPMVEVPSVAARA